MTGIDRKKIQVSVISATYNRAHLLGELLEQWKKVDENTKYEYELIFSDDESNDNTLDFLKNYTGLPLVVLENSHGGAGKARNHAVKVAKGELIIFTGDDIFPEIDFINKHFEYYKENGSKYATLGRIEWRHGIENTYLMKHITEIGCEQFGFVGLAPYSKADFRHFYTSNISIASSELAQMDRIFDTTFNKYGFEDIELGYRLYKNGVNIFYAPDILAYHDHVYNSVKKFCTRQITAGEQLAVFKYLHPEMTADEIKVDIDGFFKGYEEYNKHSHFDLIGLIGILGIKLAMPITRWLEAIIKKYDLFAVKTLCSKLFSLIFVVYFYAGLAYGLESGKSVNRNKLFRYAFHYVYHGYIQLFYSENTNFTEENSIQIKTAGKRKIHTNINLEKNGIRRLRIDPLNKECIVKNLSVNAMLTNGKVVSVKFNFSNSTKTNNLNFIGVSDPILVSDILPDDIKGVTIQFELYHLFARDVIRKSKKILKHILKCFKKLPHLLKGPPTQRVIPSLYNNEINNIPLAESIWIRIDNLNNEHIQKYRNVCKSLLPMVVISEMPCNLEGHYRPYTYAPQNSLTAMDEMQFLNAAFCLVRNQYDFVLVSNDLDYYPNIYAPSLKDALIFPSTIRSAEVFARASTPAIGKFIRIKGIRNCENILNVNEFFKLTNCSSDGIIRRNTNTTLNEVNICFDNIIKKKKPIILVLPVFMAVGGVERNTVEVMRRLSEKFDFVIITYEHHSKNHGSLFHQIYGICKAFFDFSEISFFSQYLENLARLKYAYNPDAVWIPNSNPWYFDNLPALRGIFCDIPMIAQDVYDEIVGWIAHYDRPGVKSYDRYIAINSKIKERFIDKYGINEDQIDLIYPAIDVDKLMTVNVESFSREVTLKNYGLDPKKQYFAFIGRVTEQKQPLKFIELAVKAMKQYNNVEFIMVGNGDLNDKVEEEINRLSIKDQFHRIKYIEQIYSFTKAIDGLIITSIYEGLPIVSIEAMCVGTPIMSTDVGDVKLFIERFKMGVVSKSFEIDDIENAFDEFFTNLKTYKENTRKSMSENISFFSSQRAAELTEHSIYTGMRKYACPKGISVEDENKKPLVSVIIPSYNHEKYIKQAVESVLCQTYENLELIVIDDGSIDHSCEIVSKIKDNRLTFINQENKGAHNAINRGLNMARGEYLAILNSDDVFHPDRLRQCVNTLEKSKDILLVCTYIEIINANGISQGIKMAWRNMEPWQLKDRSRSYAVTNDFAKNLLSSNFISTTSNMIFRREVFEKIGGMRNLRYAHDWDFALRVVKLGKCAIIEKPLIQYRIHDSNTISKGRKHMLFEICWMYATHLPKLVKDFVFESDAHKDLEMLFNSTNLQGNDKLVWVMISYFEAQKQKGVLEPEIEFLENVVLRESLFEYIKE